MQEPHGSKSKFRPNVSRSRCSLDARCLSRREWDDRRMKSLQETYAPANRRFGCGPANEKGLRIRSFPQGDECVAEFRPELHHEAFPGVLNGGTIGARPDCQSNGTAAWALMRPPARRRRPAAHSAVSLAGAFWGWGSSLRSR